MGAPGRPAGQKGSEATPHPETPMQDAAGIDRISAITLATHDMARAIRFYRALGFELHRGGDDARLTCLRAGRVHLNLIVDGSREWSWWGRLILHVPNVDDYHQRLLDAGLEPDFPPRDAIWHERYFHITDPDGHELSFVHPLAPSDAGSADR